MKITGSAVLGVERARLWAALQDPAVLACTIPGCERLEALGGDVYRMTLTAGVASIKGVYEGEVALAEPEEPERFVLRARGRGAPGTVDATVRVRLSEAPGGTRVDYDAEAVVGGMIGGVGQRMLTSVARRTAGEFFAAVERHLTTAPVAAAVTAPAAQAEGVTEGAAAPAAAAEPQPAAAPAANGSRPVAGQVFERPAAAGRPAKQGAQHPPAWTMLTAFALGAGVALGGVAVGWLFGRAARRGC
ncbi:MAG: carbon monoxide dehydrogenase subunit G [Actinomycetes bacterium]|jgi:uncharacterized protein|nr:MAG: carbon monoxide dehydrogenase [Actinomycetota bacterium]